MHHLKPDIIDGYVERSLDAKTLARFDSHVRGCLACALSLSERGAGAAQWERRGLLGRLVQIEEPTVVPARFAQPERARAA